ncbi:related to branched-chain alpha-keto acid dehydrogenase complex [Fusarium proliferatum]|nr:related to branched-chain alpha-keto acid dehydrogenase complex [Fusarium proliferatum]
MQPHAPEVLDCHGIFISREGITECQVVKWLVKPGDEVREFDPICEVQSDKASVEISSRFSGRITKLHYNVDDMAIVGSPLIDVDVENGDFEPQVDPESEPSQGTEFDSSNIQETISATTPDSEQPPASRVMEDGNSSSALSRHPGAAPHSSHTATPAVRTMLRQHGIKIEDVKGAGKSGRVTKEDMQRHLESQKPTRPSNDLETPVAQDRTIPLKAIQARMFESMTRSLAIPHFLYSHSVDMTLVNSVRKRINGDPSLAAATQHPSSAVSHLTTLPFIMKAVSHAFLHFPLMNCLLDTTSEPDQPTVIIKASHNFGIAVDTPRGLVVPVIRDVQKLSVSDLATEIERLSGLARDNRLSPGDLAGATYTFSNMGSIGGGVISPIIVPPMIGILGIGRMGHVPVFETDAKGVENIVKREQVTLSWAADHRALDGATVARCAQMVDSLLRNVDCFIGTV